MPTAAKLLAALIFAGVGFLGAEAYKPQLPESTQFGVFSLVVAAVGAFVGWTVMGKRAGRGWGTSLGVGLTTSAVLVVSAIFLFSVREMLLRSYDRRFRDPMEAVVGTFDIFLDYAVLSLEPRLLVILAAGGLLGGVAAEFAARRWK